LDPELTRSALMALLQEHAELDRMTAKLVMAGELANAEYICVIMQTDLAELGDVPAGFSWLRPGDPCPLGWHIYDAARRWCRGGFRDYP
jgi:hypothetical protein